MRHIRSLKSVFEREALAMAGASLPPSFSLQWFPRLSWRDFMRAGEAYDEARLEVQ